MAYLGVGLGAAVCEQVHEGLHACAHERVHRMCGEGDVPCTTEFLFSSVQFSSVQFSSNVSVQTHLRNITLPVPTWLSKTCFVGVRIVV